MLKGKIKRMIRDRGFGFIEAEDGKEIFFHQTGIVEVSFDELKEGDEVEFDPEENKKGWQARNVVKQKEF